MHLTGRFFWPAGSLSARGATDNVTGHDGSSRPRETRQAYRGLASLVPVAHWATFRTTGGRKLAPPTLQHSSFALRHLLSAVFFAQEILDVETSPEPESPYISNPTTPSVPGTLIDHHAVPKLHTRRPGELPFLPPRPLLRPPLQRLSPLLLAALPIAAHRDLEIAQHLPQRPSLTPLPPPAPSARRRPPLAALQCRPRLRQRRRGRHHGPVGPLQAHQVRRQVHRHADPR